MYINAFTLHHLYSKKIVRRFKLNALFEMLNYLLFNCSVPASAKIGEGSFCSHRGMSVVIHKNAIIGRNTVIGTCVTIGGKGKNQPGAPTIGNNCYIATGAKILGPVTIGNSVTVGANSVVTSDIPDGATFVGVPARDITKRN